LEDQVKLTVDGKELQVPKGTLLWEACKAEGIDIPIFCYHTKLGPVGACRTCLVEVEGQTKGPITACSTPVADGMVVRTRSPIVEKAQRGILEFLLLNHPLDCPICDRAGECPLQDQTFSYGPGTSRYIEPKRHHVKPVALGPTVALDRERCVLCWRCVRFCSEIAEDKSIVLLDRGDHTIVGTFQDKPYVSNFSGNVIELCPVGALTSRKQRFNFRPWELQNRPSICPHCPMGCNINVSVRKSDEVIRFLSRDNPEVDDSWLCDRGRFNFEFINSPERLRSPLIRRGDAFEETSWSEALEFIAGRLQSILETDGPDAVAGVASPRLTNEDLYIFRRFMRDVVGTRAVDHYPRPQLALTPSEQASLRSIDEKLMPIAGLNNAKTIILLGADPSEREPVMELRVRQAINKSQAKLAVLNPDEITLSSKAHRTLRYAPERFADMCRSLAAELHDTGSQNESQATSSSTPDEQNMWDLVQATLKEGPFAVIYDDSFTGVTDKGDAVSALASVVDALGTIGSVGTLPLLDACNSMGARDLDVLPITDTGASWGVPLVQQLMSPGSPVRAAFVLGSNLVKGEPGLGLAEKLRGLDLLVVHELFLTDTARLADVILPAASFAEKLGTFTNTERRVQAITETVPAPGIARADWEILVDLSQYLERPLSYTLPGEIWAEIAAEVPAYRGLSLSEIGGTGARPRALQPA
jgi:NADH-quinone oxidoreductase subunit G